MNLYSQKEVSLIQDSGKIAYETHMLILENLESGISTLELDSIAHKHITSQNATPAFLGYHNYPNTICSSINSEVVHGLPSENSIVKEGDIVSIDLGVIYKGYYSDTAWTWPIGKISDEAKKLITITQQCLYKAIKNLNMVKKIGGIGELIQRHAEGNDFSVVRDLVGHGIGKNLHEEPQIPNYGNRKNGIPIKEGMVIAIEPMINAGGFEVVTNADGWTYKTQDGKLSAHFEHTIAITKSGPVICTLPVNSEINVFKLMNNKKQNKQEKQTVLTIE